MGPLRGRLALDLTACFCCCCYSSHTWLSAKPMLLSMPEFMAMPLGFSMSAIVTVEPFPVMVFMHDLSPFDGTRSTKISDFFVAT